MAKKPKVTPATVDKNTFRMGEVFNPVRTAEHVEAASAQSPIHLNAQTARIFLRGTFGDVGITESAVVLRDKVEQVQAGDLSDVEAMLTAQATALNAIFTEMARRAALNMGEYITAADTYMRMALKAQSQCRTTLETLAEIKNPRQVAFVKQANIAHGPQQVNNGMVAGGELLAHGNNSIQSNELLGAGNELLPDTRASQAQSRVNSPVEAVGEIHRATN